MFLDERAAVGSAAFQPIGVNFERDELRIGLAHHDIDTKFAVAKHLEFERVIMVEQLQILLPGAFAESIQPRRGVAIRFRVPAQHDRDRGNDQPPIAEGAGKLHLPWPFLFQWFKTNVGADDFQFGFRKQVLPLVERPAVSAGHLDAIVAERRHTADNSLRVNSGFTAQTI